MLYFFVNTCLPTLSIAKMPKNYHKQPQRKYTTQKGKVYDCFPKICEIYDPQILFFL